MSFIPKSTTATTRLLHRTQLLSSTAAATRKFTVSAMVNAKYQEGQQVEYKPVGGKLSSQSQTTCPMMNWFERNGMLMHGVGWIIQVETRIHPRQREQLNEYSPRVPRPGVRVLQWKPTRSILDTRYVYLLSLFSGYWILLLIIPGVGVIDQE